jgi:hypothetical protein
MARAVDLPRERAREMAVTQLRKSVANGG